MHIIHAEKRLQAETGFDWMRGRLGLETSVPGFAGLSQLTRGKFHAPAIYTVNYGRNF
jgi:hypothetical protein